MESLLRLTRDIDDDIYGRNQFKYNLFNYIPSTHGSSIYGLPIRELGLQVLPRRRQALRPRPRPYYNVREEMRVQFDEEQFAEGRFRYAYKGTWIQPRSMAGQACVVKAKKDTYTWQTTAWNITTKLHEKSQKLAEDFNKFSSANCPISFPEVNVLTVVRKNNPYTRPKLDEFIIVEEYISGTFKKWCSNYGFISAEAATGSAQMMPAFMHWSWVATEGELMISDLQGVHRDNCFKLTDPAILSLSGEYGSTDMGIEGMAMFFLHHKCNEFCEKLPKPTLSDFRGKLPSDLFAPSSTSYTFELRFPETTRRIITKVFKDIAQKK